ncbi:hypothetical protein [Variovorax ginsengisoli]|uniref:hypothetical protein n=1 Tax=Variovorax ginsengisoli TaxID=363844 RepID=UPI0027D840BD|nr:hypothetical protein [Variovorax ginsengisoli]
MKFLSIVLVALAFVSACSGVPNAGDHRADDNRAGASRSGVEVFGTIDAGVSRYEKK